MACSSSTLLGVLVAVTAAGCGTSSAGGAGGGDAGAGGAAADATGAGGNGGTAGGEGVAPEPTQSGRLFVGRGRVAGHDDAWDGAYVMGDFRAEPLPDGLPSSCDVTEVDRCWARVCTLLPPGEQAEPGTTPFVSAGRVTVEGLTTPVTMGPDDGEYWIDLEGERSDPDQPFASGAALGFVAEGDEVPPFEVTLPAPARVTFTAPVLNDDLVIVRDEELVVTWNHGPGAGTLAATVEVEEPAAPDGSMRLTTVQCEADVVDGSLTIPAALLGKLPVDQHALVLVVAREDTEVVAGDWRVHAGVVDYTMVTESVELR